MNRPKSLLILPCLCITLTGCSSLPSSIVPTSLLQPVASEPRDLTAQSNAASDPFQATAKAQSQNAIVLHVLGAKQPSRILPLPDDGRTVHVSDLLKQSGLKDDFPRMKATLYRNSVDAMSGVRMGVRFLPRSNDIAPEHDYALRAGDRLEVVELEVNPFESLGSLLSPSSGRRSFMLY